MQSAFLQERLHSLHQILKGAGTPEKLGTWMEKQVKKWQMWDEDNRLSKKRGPEDRGTMSFAQRHLFLSLEDW